MKKRILVLMLGLSASLSFISCGGSAKTNPPSGLKERVLASQGVSSTFTAGSLDIIDAQNDTVPRVSPLSAGTSPSLIVLSPTRNIAAAFDAIGNTVYAIDTVKETGIGSVRLPGSTTSMTFPTAEGTGYAAVPTATVNGFRFLGAVEMMSFSTSALTPIAVAGAQTVVSDSTGTQLLVFSNDSDSVTVLNPGNAVPPVDTSCLAPPNSVCTVVTGFSRPVNAIVNGTTAYILNCGLQCGATQPATSAACGTPNAQACISIFDLPSLTITNTIPVDAATMALLNGSTLYVAGTPPTNNDCTGQLSNTGQQTAATICGRLDVVDLGSLTVTGSAKITDGFHDRMDLTANGQVFAGSRDCTNIGNVNNPSGEVRGCLSIFKTADGSVLIPPDTGDVNGLQGFVSRDVEYVAEGGALRVYDTKKDILLINDFLPQGTINIVGYIGDVKAIDFF